MAGRSSVDAVSETSPNLGGTAHPGWCCVQAGHRERYAIPRALARAGRLDRLITDFWSRPRGFSSLIAFSQIGRRLRDRFHPEIPAASVKAVSMGTMAWEVAASLRRLQGGDRTLARNAWWAESVARMIPRQVKSSTGVLFSYCYDCAPVFRAARALGIAPVLGQIDPGPVEDRKVAELVRRWSRYRTEFKPGSNEYYASWREECQLAERILVNSRWSRDALIAEGIDADKIRTVPLVYTPPAEVSGWRRTYPSDFSKDRPLRVLFLGQCILRKGIAETLEAAERLADWPVEFTLVGNTDITDLPSHFGRGRVRYLPRVSREECPAFFREADVFLFPTHSDGFGLTQLEAQAWRLPIIASKFCAEVVEENRTGLILAEVSTEAIVGAIDTLLKAPAQLARFAETVTPWPFDLNALSRELCAAVELETIS